MMLLQTPVSQFLCEHVLISLGYVPISRIAGFYDSSLFNFLRNYIYVMITLYTSVRTHQIGHLCGQFYYIICNYVNYNAIMFIFQARKKRIGTNQEKNCN